MAKDLRTKINELPVCDDMELIDTLIAIGTDGKTYRVNKDNVGGKVAEWIPLNYIVGATDMSMNVMEVENVIRINIDAVQFDELFNIGGRIHLYMHSFDSLNLENTVVELSFVMGNNISEGAVFCADDLSFPFRVHSLIDDNEYIEFKISHIPGNTNDYGQVCTFDKNNTETTTISDFVIDGIYFEPLPFLNVIREDKPVDPQ